MAVEYPDGPCPPAPIRPPKIIDEEKVPMSMLPGEGIYAAPFESAKSLNPTFHMGRGSGMVIALCFQLGKWGFEVVKADHWVEVSPVFTEYYNKTIQEMNKLEDDMKKDFASLHEAIKDFELLDHDLRKYKEHLDRFEELKVAKKEKDEERIEKAQHVLRAMFVDEVDAHTGEGISMRSIAPRWPTIISDFLILMDENDTPEKVMERVKEITRPEAVILTTKNQLYVKWKELFFSTIKGRYERLKILAYSRKASIKEYRNQIRPHLSRYKALIEGRERKDERAFLEKLSWYRPDTQALAIDYVKVCAWRPFTVPEIFKVPREQYAEFGLRDAGFNAEEIKELRKDGITRVPGLPARPIMDRIVRGIIKQIEKEYGVKITPKDIVEEVKKIHTKMMVTPKAPVEVGAGPKWPFSPYYVYIEIPILRATIKLPDGGMLEDMIIEPLKAWNATQNIILGKMLEIRAKFEAGEREISALLGEIDPETYKRIEDIIKEEYPKVYEEEGEEKKKKRESPIKNIKENITKIKENIHRIRISIGEFLSKFGIDLMFVYPATYEKLMYERMSKMMQLGPGEAFIAVDTWIKNRVGAPGVEVEARFH